MGIRLTESKLRKIIREELKRMDEMPYAGGFDPVHSDNDRESFFASTITTTGPNKPGAEKFARSGRFKTLALKHFGYIPHNVWIAPMVGVGAGVYDYVDDKRLDVQSLSGTGRKALAAAGFKVPDEVDDNDVVILYTTMSVEKDSWATPWMIIHAMFDNTDSMASSGLVSSWWNLYYSLIYGDGDLADELAPLVGEDVMPWSNALTFASARNKAIQSAADSLAEMMCQELLTKSGLVFKPEVLDDEQLEAMKTLQAHVKAAAAEFRKNIKGKLIIVGVN